MAVKPLSTTTGMTQAQIQKWRQRGESEKRVVFLFFSVLFSAIVASVLLLSVTAFPAPQMGGYQRQRRMRMGPDQQLARLSKELKLTKDQKTKIKPIVDSQFQEMSRLRQDNSRSWQDKRAKFMEIRTKTMDQIRPLLTDKQQAKLEEIQQRRQKRMRQWQSSHAGPSGPQTQ